MDFRMGALHRSIALDDRYDFLERTRRTPLYTTRIQNFKDPYVKTSQLDAKNNLSFNQENTQKLSYPNINTGRPPQESKNRYNYAIDNYVTNRVVDVSGSLMKNSNLRIQPNIYTTPGKF
jgi:hypothetical protein